MSISVIMSLIMTLLVFQCDGEVLMADGTHTLVRNVAVDDQIAVPGGKATISAVWRANVGRCIPMVSINGVLLTPDHPVEDSDAWQKATEITAPTEMYVDAIYNFALTSSHSLWVKAGTGKYVHCCTLGKPIPGIPEPLWGSDEIFAVMREMPGFPNLVTAC